MKLDQKSDGKPLMYVNESECEAADLDAEEVERIARGLSRYAKQAEALGLQIFGGMDRDWETP